MRQRWAVGNWKMHGSRAMLRAFCLELGQALEGTPPAREATTPWLQMALCPPSLYLESLGRTLGERVSAETCRALGIAPLSLGGQHVNVEASGPFTGEIAAPMLNDLGAKLCLVGHSERRRLFGETDAQTCLKLKTLLAQGLRPLLCVGESETERSRGLQALCVERQLREALFDAPTHTPEQLLVAYEPVWAIGSGKTASAEDIHAMHRHLRQVLRRSLGESATQVPLLYGGSVNPANAAALLSIPAVDGLLIGGSSLSAKSFLQIALAAPPHR